MTTAADLASQLTEAAQFGETAKTQVVPIQTHLSVVFIVGDFVYKLKKALDFGWCDNSTLAKRLHCCQDEVRLNQRLAPNVYLGVVPVVQRSSDGSFAIKPNPDASVNESETVVEYAVKMKRLNDEDTLLHAVRAESVGCGEFRELAEHLHHLHMSVCQPVDPKVSGGASTVERNMMENFEQTEAHVGSIVHPEIYSRVRQLSLDAFHNLRPIMEDRASSGKTRDTHGDLRLEHVYFDRTVRDGIDTNHDDIHTRRYVVIDCIEFNERFRCNDIFSDAAFLSMDLFFEGRGDLEREFTDTFVRACHQHATPTTQGQRANSTTNDERATPTTNDERATPTTNDERATPTTNNTQWPLHQLRDLYRFYVAYRAVVRAKVSGFKCLQPEVDPDERTKAKSTAVALWNVALHFLAPANACPALVLVGGLPGSGKSTVAAELIKNASGAAPVEWVRSDVVRKQIHGLVPSDRSGSGDGFMGGIYSPDCTTKTFDRCASLATDAINAKCARVIVDASFLDVALRRRFVALGRELGVPTWLFECACDETEIRRRLAKRTREAVDASDADFEIYAKKKDAWERTSIPALANEKHQQFVRTIRTDQSPDAWVQVAELLRSSGVIW